MQRRATLVRFGKVSHAVACPSCQTLGPMKTAELVSLAEFESERLEELVAMWRACFEAGVGVRDPNPISEQQQAFLEKVLPSNTVRMAMLGEQLVGFVAASPNSVAQLHVRIGLQRRGIGTKLLAWAKAQPTGSLWLYTFARNAGARAFYEHHGFVIAERGFEPEWQLEDIKYCWSAAEQNVA